MARKQQLPLNQAPPVTPADAGMIREGSPVGGPSVRFDPETRQNYHLNRLGARVYHGVPEGHELDDQGVPQLKAAPEDKTDG